MDIPWAVSAVLGLGVAMLVYSWLVLKEILAVQRTALLRLAEIHRQLQTMAEQASDSALAFERCQRSLEEIQAAADYFRRAHTPPL